MTEQRTTVRQTTIEGEAVPTETVAKTYMTNVHHTDEQVPGAVAGGVLGAVAGAVVGGPVGAVVGGAIGAASGATVGAVDESGKETVVVTR